MLSAIGTALNGNHYTVWQLSLIFRNISIYHTWWSSITSLASAWGRSFISWKTSSSLASISFSLFNGISVVWDRLFLVSVAFSADPCVVRVSERREPPTAVCHSFLTSLLRTQWNRKRKTPCRLTRITNTVWERKGQKYASTRITNTVWGRKGQKYASTGLQTRSGDERQKQERVLAYYIMLKIPNVSRH